MGRLWNGCSKVMFGLQRPTVRQAEHGAVLDVEAVPPLRGRDDALVHDVIGQVSVAGLLEAPEDGLE